MRVKISADSTCDLSAQLNEKYNIGSLPLYVVRDGESLRDGIDITQEDLYEHHDKTGRLCSTAAVSVADYLAYFSEVLKEYDEIVHFTISSDMSACYQNACIAAAELGNVYPVDSQSLSTGIGQLVIEAALMAQSGSSGKEIRDEMNILRDRLDVSFVVDTLEYLYKGGRCSSVAALGANLLSLKPCIEVIGGKMEVGKKFRGSLTKCILQYVKGRLCGEEGIATKRIFITHSGGEQISDELIKMVCKEILKYQSFDEIIVTRAGSTIASHCGPGTLGILFLRK